MRLDVIVPTYNRAELLECALRSLLCTEIPKGLDVRVIVVDNNSTDATPAVITRWQEQVGERLRYVLERHQGKSFALNAGIDDSDAELVGIIDDDEEISLTWYDRVWAAFADSTLDFIGGPYVPRWEIKPPAWLPDDYPGVIGWIDAGDRELPYDRNFPGILMGGNAVFRRETLHRIGPYPVHLGRTNKRLLAGEDEEIYQRLMTIGARGMYFPDLAIRHYIPAERLTRRYYRRWCFWRGVSWSMIHVHRPQQVTYVLGVPRYLFGRAARGLVAMVQRTLTRPAEPAAAFSAELAIWDLAGFLYGRHVYQRLQGPKSRDSS